MASIKSIKDNGTYKAERRGKLVFVSVLPDEVARFKRKWPHSGIQHHDQIIFTFLRNNGELVDYEPLRLLDRVDALAIKEMANNAKAFAKQAHMILV